ncbi:MAG TPA: calcium/sodium antiporter [Candidatus Paceibacterota bacterium]|nr:calcium/sodium antiporter [Candidatus Paceibacterota bacterium]HRZ34195.1 calcium/sodium antiporter [Candidatus Paceibacterota bacterium]
MIFLWVVIFVLSLSILVKGSDWTLVSAERIGLAVGLSPFVIGVTIIGFGTSLPELASSIVAVLHQAPEIVVANVVGSNIFNILVIVGFSAILARRLVVTKDLIDLELPTIAITGSIFLITAWDGVITFFEAVFLILTFLIYLGFSVIYKPDEADEPHEIAELKAKRPKLSAKDFVLLITGFVGLIVGSRYLIISVVELSGLLNIATGVIAITGVAIGTSLPELAVSTRAAMAHKSELSIGNIFGSNIFNALFVIGIPGLISSLPIDEKTLTLGLPVLVIATILFVISGISRRIHIQEGVLYVLLYAVFAAKLFNLF